jgi:enamine deaminase RidA (YjgF/YER057c/UK114 family)
VTADRRRSIHLEGLEHGAPIPSGAVVGNMVFSSAISGRDPQTGTAPADPDEQAAQMFRNLRRFMEAAGGTPEDIGHLTLYLKEEKYRDAVNKAWLAMFPDAASRPARHAVKAEMRADVLFQVAVIGVLGR